MAKTEEPRHVHGQEGILAARTLNGWVGLTTPALRTNLLLFCLADKGQGGPGLNCRGGYPLLVPSVHFQTLKHRLRAFLFCFRNVKNRHDIAGAL